MNTCRLLGHFERLFPAAPVSFLCCKQQTMQTSAEETSLLQKHRLHSRDKVQQRSGGQWCYIKLLNLPRKEIHSPNPLVVADSTGLNVLSPTECKTCSTPESCLVSFMCIIISPLFTSFLCSSASSFLIFKCTFSPLAICAVLPPSSSLSKYFGSCCPLINVLDFFLSLSRFVSLSGAQDEGYPS